MDPNSSLSTFDFNSQAGVMSLLASIRSSALSPSEKNDLRDLVFLYTNGGGDVSVRIALEQKLTANKIAVVPLASKAAVASAVTLPFGASRPAPSFKAPKVSTAPVTATPPPAAPLPEPTLSPAPAQAVPAYTPPPVPPPTAVPPTPAPVSVAVPPAPAPEPIPQPVPVAVPVVPPMPPAATTTSGGIDARYLERIREIKTAVNSKVGNPVNLVDINNAVGREYMNALLDAMKRLSGGVGQVEPAMERLEAAFVAVEAAVAAHAAAPATAAAPLPSSAAPANTLPEVMPAPAPTPTSPVMAAPMPPAMSAPLTPEVAPAPTPVVADPVILEEAVEELSSVAKGPSGFDAPVAAPSVAAPTPHSLLAEQKVLTPQDLPSAASIETGVVGDPLKTREIDDGLEQLLSDWSLFKKSGLFGTGPKGREHPLFKKIADLPIPLLLAGRFEGSTQEIKQSITDYMNGWRYEQGIIYEQGETFDHYLRRVIKQILDLQKKRRPA